MAQTKRKRGGSCSDSDSDSVVWRRAKSMERYALANPGKATLEGLDGLCLGVMLGYFVVWEFPDGSWYIGRVVAYRPPNGREEDVITFKGRKPRLRTDVEQNRIGPGQYCIHFFDGYNICLSPEATYAAVMWFNEQKEHLKITKDLSGPVFGRVRGLPEKKLEQAAKKDLRRNTNSSSVEESSLKLEELGYWLAYKEYHDKEGTPRPGPDRGGHRWVQAWSRTKSLVGNMRLVVVDGFFEHPDAARRKEDGWSFYKPEGITGKRSKVTYKPDGLKKRIKRALNISEESIKLLPGSGELFWANPDETPGVHTDRPEGSTICIVYLTPFLPQECGLSFFRHKRLNISCLPDQGLTREEEDETEKDSTDYSKWELLQSVPYRYNRAIFFPAKYFHRATKHWENRRYMLFIIEHA